MPRILLSAAIFIAVLGSGCSRAPGPESASNANRAGSASKDINARDQDGVTPLIRAVRNGDAITARQLLGQGADTSIQTNSGVTALITAAGMSPEITRMLIEKGADVNHKTPGNFTALMSAALNGQAEIVKMLLDAGADPSVVDSGGMTAQKWAESKSHKEIVAMLRAAAKHPSRSSKR
jgi:ankyrin repeat protein